MKQIIGKYMIVVRCTYYNKNNLPKPVYSGSFEYDISEEFIGSESSAVDHFKGKYNKYIVGRMAETQFEVVSVAKILLGV